MIRVATRGSALALAQAEEVRAALRLAHPTLGVALLEVATTGDLLLEVSLESVEGKGFFSGSLERAVSARRADLAAHSLKDLPVVLSPGFCIAAVLEREDPADVIASPHGGLAQLPARAVVGTDSARRRTQLAVVRPDLVFVPIRGNVPTRLDKLDRGEVDAVVLAAAGLRRLGLDHRISERLEPWVCLPAPGQGAVAVEALEDGEAGSLAAAADHAPSRAAVTAERAFLEALGGGCSTPAGALAAVSGRRLTLLAATVEAGARVTVEVAGEAAEAAAIGAEAAARMIAGARR
ncbi:MAG: hydroxymethylbilane synthase [Candidatus Dormibacterales bacterium]